MKKILMLVILAVLANSANADPISCGLWLKARESQSAATATGWIRGFLDATIALGANLRQVDKETIEAYMDKYCLDNPLHTIADGTAHLAAQLHIKKLE